MLYKFLKTISIITCCLLITITCSAQRFSAGLVVGINASQIDGDRYAGYNKLGLVGGIQASAYLTDKVDLGIELRFSQIGSRSVLSQQNTIEPFSITLNYAEVPVTINYKDWYIEDTDHYRLEFHGGLTYARLIDTKLKDESGSPFQASVPFFRDNYFGAVIGATYFITEHIGATVRFNRAILFLYKNQDDNPNQPSMFSKHLTFSAIYRF